MKAAMKFDAARLLLAGMALYLTSAIMHATATCTSGSCAAPSSSSKFDAIVAISKLQYADEDDERDLEGFCNDGFCLDGGYMRFETEDDEERSELRTPSDDEFSGSTSSAESISGRVRLSDPSSDDNYTFMQLHSTRTEDRTRPLVRLVHHGSRNGYDDYIWMTLRDNTEDEFLPDDEWIPLMARPGSSFFAASISLQSGTLTVSVGDDADAVNESHSVGWSQETCYFKAGTYVQSGTHADYPVEYSVLTYSGTYA